MIDFFFQLSRCVFTFVNSIFGAHIMLKKVMMPKEVGII